MGGAESVFLRDLTNSHSKFVNPQRRRLRLDAFRATCLLPLEMPHVKIAALKYMYVEGKLAHDFCQPPTQAVLKNLALPTGSSAVSAVAEVDDYLCFFHVDLHFIVEQLDRNRITNILRQC